MSIYKITHSCGHTVEHQIYGTNVHGEREKKAAWLESRLCYDCYKQAEAEKAAKASEDANLPELTGSETLGRPIFVRRLHSPSTKCVPKLQQIPTPLKSILNKLQLSNLCWMSCARIAAQSGGLITAAKTLTLHGLLSKQKVRCNDTSYRERNVRSWPTGQERLARRRGATEYFELYAGVSNQGYRHGA